MARRGRPSELEEELRATNQTGGYRGSIICTEQGLLVASDGDFLGNEEALAGFTSLFDEIVKRGARDLGLGSVDEVTVLDSQFGRLVIRPLSGGASGGTARARMFLVVAMAHDATWRRNTNRLVVRLRELLAPIVSDDDTASELGS